MNYKEIEIKDCIAKNLLIDSFKETLKNDYKEEYFQELFRLFVDKLLQVFSYKKNYIAQYGKYEGSMLADWIKKNSLKGLHWEQIYEKIEETAFYTMLYDKLRKSANWGDSPMEARFNFLKWYFLQEQSCYYCGVPQSYVNSYFFSNEQAQDAIKQRARGMFLELERKESKTGSNIYKSDNCVLICYVCNNAKSNFISRKDFKPIAKGINGFWNKVFEPKQFEFPEKNWIDIE